MAYQSKHIISVKDKNRELLMAYLSNPDNEFLSRNRLGKEVLGYAKGETIYTHFTPAELSLIEAEALTLRRSMYAPKLSKVDAGILNKAASGDAGAAKLCYQRFEDWSEKSRVEGVVTFEAVLNQLVGGQSHDMTNITPPDEPAYDTNMITDNIPADKPGDDTPPDSL